MYVCMCGYHMYSSKSMDQPGKVVTGAAFSYIIMTHLFTPIFSHYTIPTIGKVGMCDTEDIGGNR